MLQNIRNNIQGTVAKVIIVLISVPFVLVGAESLLSTGSQDVAEINGEDISAQQLEEAVFLQKRQLIAQQGQNIDPAMLEDSRLRKQAMESLVSRTLLLQQAEKQGLAIADAELNRMIMQNPDFQENGRFSRQRYMSMLGAIGLTPAMYKRLYRTDLLQTQYVSGIADTGFLTEGEMALQSRFLHQTRDIRYITLGLEQEKRRQQAADEEVRAFYDENPGLFQSQESVVVDYIELKQQDFEPEIDEQEIVAAYNKEVEALDSGEQRQVSHILLTFEGDEEKNKARATLEELRTRVTNGDDFAALAREYSQDVGSSAQGGALGQLLEDAYPENFVAAARGLQEGEISGVVETPSGLHLIRLDQLLRTDVPTLEQRYDALASQLREAKAGPLFWAAVEELKDVAFNAVDLQQPADVVNAAIKQSAPVTRAGGSGLFSDRKLVTIAFSDTVLKDKYNSEVINVADDHVLVMHLNEYRPAALMPFAQVAARAKDLLLTRKATAALQARSARLLAELQQGADVEQLARANDLDWQLLLAASRNTGGTAGNIVRHAFSLPAVGSDEFAVDELSLASGDRVLMVVDNVREGNLDKVDPQEKTMLQQFVAQGQAAEAFQLLQKQIEAEADVRIF
ncbi:MAG TPA: SurA N-terminal domain-containing protein [Pseudomonadales bacterium]